MKKKLLLAFVVLLVVFIGLQFVPVERTNPPVTGEIQAPDDVMAVLRQSCYDCHSNETDWPLYAYIAPVSWKVADHVNHGRSDLNFSEWDSYSASEQQHAKKEIWEEVDGGKMPLPDYLKLHDEAELTDEDKATLKAWSTATAGERDHSKDDHDDHDH